MPSKKLTKKKRKKPDKRIRNKFWEFRKKHGRNFKYTPSALWKEAVKYFKWIEATPLWEEKGFAFQGVVTKERFHKMRAMTLTGLRVYADITAQTWSRYKEDKQKKGFSEVITRIEEIVYSQKFEGAAADLLNSNIIARDLGLKEKTDVTSGDEPIAAPKIYLPDNDRN